MYEGPKALADLGLIYLEAAILEVMGDEVILPSEIAKRLGIAAYPDSRGQDRNAIVTGFLWKLAAQGRVERYHSGTRWRRTAPTQV